MANKRQIKINQTAKFILQEQKKRLNVPESELAEFAIFQFDFFKLKNGKDFKKQKG